MSGHELSVFIDESGDFGAYEHHSPFYIISLVFHDQSHDIKPDIAKLGRCVVEQGFPEEHSIHSVSLIRREGDYAGLDMGPRKVRPSDYCLLRAADVVYTLELLAAKLGERAPSSSETDFFGGERALKKNFLKPAR